MTELDSTPVLDAEEQKFISLINEHRAKSNAPPLQVSASLTRASHWMSTDMANKNYVSHTDSGNRDPFTRMKDFGYTYNTYLGENIAAGVGTAEEALNGWINECDPDASGRCTYAHNLNMLNPNYKVIGIRRVYNPNSTYKWYWTTNFGGYVDETIPVTPIAILAARRSPRNRYSTQKVSDDVKPVYLQISFTPETNAWLRRWGWLILLAIIIIIAVIFLTSRKGRTLTTRTPSPTANYRSRQASPRYRY